MNKITNVELKPNGNLKISFATKIEDKDALLTYHNVTLRNLDIARNIVELDILHDTDGNFWDIIIYDEVTNE